MVSLKVFKELQSDDADSIMIDYEYDIYKEKYESSKTKYFFKEYSNEEWFKEKYDPGYLESISKQISQFTSKKAEIFFDNFRKGVYSKSNFCLSLKLNEDDEELSTLIDYNVQKQSNRTDDLYEADNIDIPINNGKLLKINFYKGVLKEIKNYTSSIFEFPYFGLDIDSHTIFINYVPTYLKRKDIYNKVCLLQGFISLYFSEVFRNQNNNRYCWIRFDNEHNLQAAIESLSKNQIEKVRLNPIRSKSEQNKINITPPLFSSREQIDIDFTKELIHKYDKKRNILSNPLLSSDNSFSTELQLDLQILYLRNVYNFCFYCCEEYDNEKQMILKCGNAHLRHYRSLNNESSDDNILSKEYDAWLSNSITKKIQNFVEDALVVDEEIINRKNDYVNNNTIHVQDDKYKCNLCPKMFKGSHFVKNHLLNRHDNEIYHNVEKEVSIYKI